MNSPDNFGRYFILDFLFLTNLNFWTYLLFLYSLSKNNGTGNEHIEIHEINTNTFGKSRLSGKYIIEYDLVPGTFETFEGRSAQIASEIMRIKPELVIIEKEIVLQLAENNYLKDVLFYLDDTKNREVIIIDKYSVGSIRDMNCGIKVEAGMSYRQIPDEYFTY